MTVLRWGKGEAWLAGCWKEEKAAGFTAGMLGTTGTSCTSAVQCGM